MNIWPNDIATVSDEDRATEMLKPTKTTAFHVDGKKAITESGVVQIKQCFHLVVGSM